MKKKSGEDVSHDEVQAQGLVLFTENQAMRLLRISRSTLWRARREGRIHFYRQGTRVLYDRRHLLAYLRRVEC